MSRATSPVDAVTTVDRLTSAQDIVELAQIPAQLDGTKPYVWLFTIDGACAAADLLPTGATIERCVTTDTSVSLLAHLDDATIHVRTFPRFATVRVAAVSHDRADRVAADMRMRSPEVPSDTATVRVWHRKDTSFISADRCIEAPSWADIAPNYPPPVRRGLDALHSLSRPAGMGKLLLWHGPPGTGKTTALRSLMRSWAAWCQSQYIADPERFFGEPAYIAQVLTRAPVATVGPTLTRAGQPEAIWRLVIAEDTDEYLRASARHDAGAALGRLLNLADGILGQGLNIVVLLTTNEPVSRLHPALIRPGRCLAELEFASFDPTQASAWLDAVVDTPMTLAELLERRGDLATLGTSSRPVPSPGQYL